MSRPSQPKDFTANPARGGTKIAKGHRISENPGDSTVQNFPDPPSKFPFRGPKIPGVSLRTNGEAVGTGVLMRFKCNVWVQTRRPGGVAVLLLLLIVAGGCTTIGEVFPFARSKKEGDPSFAPFVVTPLDVVQEMLKLAEVRQDDVIFDLGSGDGRIVITAAREYGAKGVGFDLQPDLVRRARDDARQAGVGGLVEFYVQDVLTVDLTGATVVTIYLSREANLTLRPRLLSQLRPGSRVISHEFDMGEWQPSRILRFRDTAGGEHTLLLWHIPK